MSEREGKPMRAGMVVIPHPRATWHTWARAVLIAPYENENGPPSGSRWWARIDGRDERIVVDDAHVRDALANQTVAVDW